MFFSLVECIEVKQYPKLGNTDCGPLQKNYQK